MRSDEQVAILRGIGSEHVVNSTAPSFADDLLAALMATEATLAFNAIGGGSLADRILTGMERAASAGAPYSRYGTTTHKQVYIYGALDVRPTELSRGFGMTWGVGGWLTTPSLQRAGHARRGVQGAHRGRIRTIFASGYTRTLWLAEALYPENIAAYAKRAAGEKYLIDPSRSAPA